MPFNTLLLTCLSPKTSFQQQGSGVFIEPQSGESILVFSIDQGAGEFNKIVRQILNLGDEPICDLIVYYAKDSKKVICFVELKGQGSGVTRAIKQITTTYDGFKRSLKGSTIGQHCQRLKIVWKAYIFHHGGSPSNIKKLCMEKLEREFKKGNYKICSDRDLGKFLRD